MTTSESKESKTWTDEIPNGARQALMTGVAVVLTFSLLYLKFMIFDEESGEWTKLGRVAAALGALSCAGQLYTIWRGLQISNGLLDYYNGTIRWFGMSIVALVISIIVLLVAFAVYSNPNPS